VESSKRKGDWVHSIREGKEAKNMRGGKKGRGRGFKFREGNPEI